MFKCQASTICTSLLQAAHSKSGVRDSILESLPNRRRGARATRDNIQHVTSNKRDQDSRFNASQSRVSDCSSGLVTCTSPLTSTTYSCITHNVLGLISDIIPRWALRTERTSIWMCLAPSLTPTRQWRRLLNARFFGVSFTYNLPFRRHPKPRPYRRLPLSPNPLFPNPNLKLPRRRKF